MTAIAYYLLKVFICSGILFLYYHLALKNKIFHQWNRFYLLLAVVLSILLPLFQFTIWRLPGEEDKAIDLILFMQSADNYLEEITISSSPSVSPEQWIQYAYSLFSVVLLISFLLSVIKIFRIIQTHTVQLFNRIKFINTKEPGAPFSFLHYIFWNDKISLQSETGQQIFQHELVHVHEKHTLDKLLMQTVLVFFWCNPFFWLIRRELTFIHEFIADKKAVGTHGTEAFAAMIMQAVYPQHYHTITNQFFQKSIKRRILMLTKIQNPKVAYASRIIALPVIAIIAFAFTVRTEQLSGEPVQKNFSAIITGANDTIPKKKKEISSVDVRKDTEKKINTLTITYNDGTSETLTDKEAAKRGLLTNEDQNKEVIVIGDGKNKDNLVKIKSSDAGPLFILDEKETTKEEMEKIIPNSIESINVLKDNSATDKYGTKGKNGVIEIKLKSKSSDEKITIQENGKQIGSGTIEVNNYATEVKGTFEIDDLEKEKRIFTKAEFPASIDKDEWRSFLQKNLISVIEYLKNKGMPPGNYATNVQFIVEKDGSLSDVKIVKHPGYNLDKKILEMMKGSPRWKPAIQNGQAVRSYHTQPITMQISEQNTSEDTTTQ